MFVLGVIPARGGSKSIPNKNIATLAGKPLIAHTIEAALGCKVFNDLILSTDSPIIACCAAQYGLLATDLRPPELATDTARSIDVVLYELQKYERDHSTVVNLVVLLQPTAPMRTAKDIDQALEIFFRSSADSLVSVYEASFVHPSIMYYMEDGRLSPVLREGRQLERRQEFKPVFVRNGSLYIVKRALILEKKTLACANPAAYIMPRERSLNIDEPYDLELAEWMMRRHV